jgi:hypothetical protein
MSLFMQEMLWRGSRRNGERDKTTNRVSRVRGGLQHGPLDLGRLSDEEGDGGALAVDRASFNEVLEALRAKKCKWNFGR